MDNRLKLGIILILVSMCIYGLATHTDKFTVDESQKRLFIAPMWGITCSRMYRSYECHVLSSSTGGRRVGSHSSRRKSLSEIRSAFT